MVNLYANVFIALVLAKAMYVDVGAMGWSLFFLGLGAWCFFRGFARLRRKRLIENIPTSTIRGLALGLVELIGRATAQSTLQSPLSKTKCIFYRYTIERYEKRGKHSRWVTIANGDSSYFPFWLEDDTGRILVFAQGAEVILPMDYEFTTGWRKPPTSELMEFMESKGLRYRGFFGTHTLRFREWYICPEESVYVLGTAKKSGDPLGEHKEKVMRRLMELKNSQVKMQELDLDKNGEVSMKEWDLAVAKVEQEVLEQELKAHQSIGPVDVIIAKGDTEKVFIISDHSQKDLIGKLFLVAVLGIVGGALMALVALWFLLAQLGVQFAPHQL